MIPNLMLRRRPFPRTGMLAAAAVLALAAGQAGAADLAKGKSLYATHCAVCHGADGTPVMPGATNFRRLDATLMKPDMMLLPPIRNGKGTMPGFFGILRDQEILDVVAYLRTLS